MKLPRRDFKCLEEFDWKGDGDMICGDHVHVEDWLTFMDGFQILIWKGSSRGERKLRRRHSPSHLNLGKQYEGIVSHRNSWCNMHWNAPTTENALHASDDSVILSPEGVQHTVPYFFGLATASTTTASTTTPSTTISNTSGWVHVSMGGVWDQDHMFKTQEMDL